MIEVVLITNVFSGARHAQRLTIDRPRAAVCDLLPDEWLKHKDHVMPVRGMQRLDWDQEVVSGERIALVMVPRGLEAATIALLKTALIINTIAFVVMRALMPKPPRQREDNSSAVYGYNGIEPSRVEGEPIPLYYGELRVGGQIINEFVEDYGANGSRYQALVSLGEGPLEEIAGQTEDTSVPLSTDGVSQIPRFKVYLNDTDASELDDVQVQVRMGTLEQTPCEGFEFATSTVAIDTELANPTTTAATSSEAVIDYSNPVNLAGTSTSANSTWTTAGVTYSTTVEAEGAVIKVLLPEGASYTNDDGSLSPINTGVAVRYIELDGGGSPITTGGQDSDGYVRLRPFRFYKKLAPGTAYDISVPLYDPQTYTRPAIQNCASFNSGGAIYYTTSGGVYSLPNPYLNRTTGLTVPAGGPVWTSTGAAESFTVECFFFPRTLSGAVGGISLNLASTTVDTNPTDTEWVKVSGTGSQGFTLGHVTKTYSPQAGQTVSRRVPYISFGGVQFTDSGLDASYTVQSYIASVNLATDLVSFRSVVQGTPGSNGIAATANDVARTAFYAWQHCVATYEKDADGVGRHRVRLYANGVKIVDQVTSTSVTLPNLSTCSLTLRGPGTHGRLSNVAIYKGVMDPATVLNQYNNGNGRTSIQTDLFPVVFYKFASSGALLTDSSGNGNTLTNNAVTTVGVTSTSGGAIIPADTANTATVKKSKYKIEVLRQFKNSTSTRMADAQRWQTLRLLDFEPFSYPTAPLLAISSRATSELNGNIPRVTSVIKGKKVPVWDGTSIQFPTFDSTFSKCPAWIVMDMLLDKNWGLGNIFANTDIDIQSFKEWADYCDEAIYNQSGYTVSYSATTTAGGLVFNDIFYNSSNTAYSNLATIEFECPVDSVPSTVRVGDYIGIYGAPVVPTYTDYNNTSAAGGYEIIDIVSTATKDVIICHYDLASAPWNDVSYWSAVLSVATLTPAGTIQGRHPRFEFDGAVDTQRPAWEVILDICKTARAVPIRMGRRIKVAVYKPRPVVDLVGLAQVERDSFQIDYLSPQTRFNQIEVGFLDRDLNYERSMISAEHSSIQGTTDSGLLRRRQVTLDGVVRRAQAAREAQFLLNMEHLVRRRGRFTGSVDLVGLEPLDVVQIAHDVIDRGVSGRVSSDSSTTSEIYLDRAVTLAAATTYKILHRSASAPTGFEPEERTISTAAGTYYVGTALAVSTAFSYTPTKDDVYILSVDGDSLLAQIDSITLTPDLKREVSFTEYVEAAFDVELPNETPDITDEFLTASEPALGSSSVPPIVDDVRVEEMVMRGPGGAHQPRLLVTWLFDSDSDQTAGFDIWLALEDGANTNTRDYTLISSSSGAARSAVLVLDNALVGKTYTVAVTAKSASGAARTPSRAAKASVRIIGKSPPPSAPAWDSAYPAVMDGEQATYRVVPASLEQGSTIEIRRGGWILGQRVGAVPTDTGKLGPTPNWASAVNTSLSAFNHLHGLGLPGAQLVVRAISNKGKYSTADVIEWAPRVIDAESVVDSGNNTYYTRSWEDFGIGWRRSGAVFPNSTLTNCQVTTSTLFPQGYLEFSGSNLTATYTTATHNIPVDQRAEWWYNSAYATVEQIWPTTWADATYGWDDVGQQWSWEGPLNTLENGDDPGRVTFIIETKAVDENGVESDWSQFTPGKVRGIYAYWRLTMTRPSTAYNIRVYHFATQLLRIPRQRFERSGLQYFAEHQIFGRA